jgi:hypothetical protein
MYGEIPLHCAHYPQVLRVVDAMLHLRTLETVSEGIFVRAILGNPCNYWEIRDGLCGLL